MGRHTPPAASRSSAARSGSGRSGGARSGGARLGGLGLGARQFTADPWVSLGLALLVGLVALLLTAVPRALTDVQGRQLVQDVTGLSAAQRDVIGQWTRTVETPSFRTWDPEMMGLSEADHEQLVEDPWAPFREGAERIRTEQPQPLRDVLGRAQMTATVRQQYSLAPEPETGFVEAVFTLRVDPDLAEHVELVEGDWPELTYEEPMGHSPDGEPRPSEGDPVEVILSQDAANRLHLSVGAELTDKLVLAGIYQPQDPEDPRWQHVDNAARLGVVPDADKGDSAYATVFLSPQNRGSTGQPGVLEMQLWYPVEPGRITGRTAEVETLRGQLTGFLAQEHVLATSAQVMDTPADQIPIFGAELTSTLDQIVTQQRATSSLLAVVAAGPLGVALAVAALGARLVVHRRRPALAMTLARGASPTQLRWLVAAEGLVLGIPAAVLGHLAATLLITGPTPWWQWVVTGVIALVPSVTLAASLDDASLLQQRRDLSGRSHSRWRWVVEVAVVALAAVATWRLLDRGTRGDEAADSGIDLLAAGTPVLLALAACLITLRLYPLPLGALTAGLRGRASLTPFVGAARALRDPAGGLVPALAVVLGTAIALVSAVLLSTVTRGAESAAWESNGGAIKVAGPPLTQTLRERLEGIEGVAAVAGVTDSGQTGNLVLDGGGREAVRIWLVDPAMRQVQAGSPQQLLPGGLFAGGTDGGDVDGADAGTAGEGAAGTEGTDGTVGIVTLSSTTVDPAASATLSKVGDVQLLDHLDRLPGVDHATGVVLDRSRWEAAGGSAPPARIILVGLADGADADQVGAAIGEAMGERAGVRTTVAERLEQFAQAPVTRGLTGLFVGATVVSGLLTVLAVVIVQLMGSTARARLLSVLRTLGLAPGQTRALTAWELAPLLVVSIVVGGLLGLAIPWVLLRGLDLTGLTAGAAQPPLVLDPVVVAAVLGAVVLTVLIAVAVSAWLAGRTNLAQALRVGEER